MSVASVILAAALAAWGPVAPAPEGPGATDVADPEGTTAPAAGEGEPTPPPPAPLPPAPPPPPAAAPAGSAAPLPSMVARAPLDVRATPAIVVAPRSSSQPGKPLQKQWSFWVIVGGLFAATIVVTYVATRPGPEPYTGNAPPFFVSFP